MPRLSLQLFLLLAVFLCVIAITYLIPLELRKAALEENGFVENATLFGYILCIYLMMRKGGPEWVRVHWRLLLIPLLLLAREADFHAKYTTTSIIGTKYFFDGSQSPLSLAIGAIIVLFVFWVFASIAWNYARCFLRKLLEFDLSALFVGLAILFAIAAKTIDGTARKLTRYEMELNEHTEILALLVEEMLELGIPLALCLAVLNYIYGASVRKPLTGYSFGANNTV